MDRGDERSGVDEQTTAGPGGFGGVRNLLQKGHQTQLLVARKGHDQQVEAFSILWMTQCLRRARSIAYMLYMLI